MSHFYDREGKPVYQVPNKSKPGQMRDTSLRDARKLDLAVGVTTILKVAASPQLTDYIINETIEACIETPYIKPQYSDMGVQLDSNDDIEEYKKSILDKGKAKLDKQAEAGTAIHKALEMYYLTGIIDVGTQQHTLPVIKEIEARYPGVKFIPEETFNYNGLYGGSIDLHSSDGDGIVLDFKVKDRDAERMAKLKGYDNNMQQVAAYREGLGLPKAETGNIFISSQVPGLHMFEIYTEEQTARAWRMFRCLLSYWHLDKNFKEVLL